ncbi:MAG: antirestriction protein ArdA [Defluviitaleaceae bacterium]|nr:antirestriction protein ArdA [Defluviitaleaceae bacterium]
MKHISIDEVKQMTDSEGLVLQGCGGDPGDWLKGINEMLTEAGILKNGGAFEDISVFEHSGVTNILFPFDDLTPNTLDMGKLAVWRLQTREHFGGTWLSDYLPNQLGIGRDGPDIEEEPSHATIDAIGSTESVGAESSGQENSVSGIAGDQTLDNSVEDSDSLEDSDSADNPSRLQVYIENTHDSAIGGFTIPLPTTLEDLKPFMESSEIAGWQDMRIWEIYTDIDGLGDRLYDHVAKAATPELFDELNYLAARLGELSEDSMYIFAANMEAGKNCGSLAEMINLTFDENLNSFDVWPVFGAHDYGDTLVNQFSRDEHAIVFNRLLNSDDPADRAFAAHIEKLEKYVDLKAFGLITAKEEGGIFTEQGYLVGGDDIRQIYRSLQDIPADHSVFMNPDEATRPMLHVKNVDIAETLVKLHAVTGDHIYTANSLKTLITSEHCNDYFMSVNNFGIRFFGAMDAYKRGSSAFDVFTVDGSDTGRSVPDGARKISGANVVSSFAEGKTTDRVFAVQVTTQFKNAEPLPEDKGRQFVMGNVTEINQKALSASINRHAVAPNLMDTVQADGSKKSYDLITWAELPRQEKETMQSHALRYPDEGFKNAQFRFSVLRDESMAACQGIDVKEFLAAVNTTFMAEAKNPQPDMIRIAGTAAKEILARSDVDVYKLTQNGAEKLSAVEALRAQTFANHPEFAIKANDADSLNKWAQRTVDSVAYQIEKLERGEQKKTRTEEI